MELPQCVTKYTIFFFVGKAYGIGMNGMASGNSEALCFSMLLRAFQYYVLIELMHMPNTSTDEG